MKKELVYLVQTDTTVGFSSSDDEKLSRIKERPLNQKILQTVDSFNSLKSKTRVPNSFKKRVRYSKKTTFIYPNGNSFRVIENRSNFIDFIKKFNCLFSTSANLTKNSFDYDFALKNCDVAMFSKEGFSEKSSSTIYKINNKKIKRVR